MRSVIAALALLLGAACSPGDSAGPDVEEVQYGAIAVTMTGVPAGSQATVTISGPSGTHLLDSSGTVPGLAPGTYLVTATNLVVGGATYLVTPTTQSVTVTAGSTTDVPAITWTLVTGALTLSVNGLPDGKAANVIVSGPDGFVQAVSASGTLSGLKPGSYTVDAQRVVTDGFSYDAIAPMQVVTVAAQLTPAAASVSYFLASGALSITVAGLPGSTQGVVRVTGPGGYLQVLGSSGTLSNLAPGTYTIAADPVTTGNGTSTFVPTPASQAISVTSSTVPVEVLVTYDLATGVNLVVDGAHITQAVQTFDGSVPLVANRNALLRVFVRASQSNTARPVVRVRFYSGATLVQALSINAPAASVPTSITEGVLGSSWNIPLGGAMLQPGLSLLVDVDPDGTIPETNEADNTWPASGTPAALDVRTVSSLGVRFVPIHQSANGLTGNVSEANKATYLAPLERMFPIAGLDADLHAEYTTDQAVLASGGSNWTAVLAEILALRIAEGSSRYYYGVAKVGYTSGVAGLGYIGVPAAMGWDHLPSGAEVMAHELGHTFGRWHAPCGGPAQIDGNWPNATHPGAIIGSFGYDIVEGVLKPTSQFDLMSYCDPAWVSDYTYKGVLNYRLANPDVVSAEAQAANRVGQRSKAAASERSLLVWGRIESGRVILEPAFEVDAPASMPARRGPHRIEALDAAGRTLFALSFEGERVADLGDPNDRLFAFAVPVSMLNGTPLATLRLTSGSRQVERRASAAARLLGDTPVLTRLGARARVKWPATSAGALIRNARTGEVMAISRGGSIDIPSGADELDVILSDGIRSSRTRVRPQ